MLDRINDIIFFNRKIRNANLLNDEVILDGLEVYDVIRIINKVPLFLEDHFNRLRTNTNHLGISLEIKQNELKSLIDELIKECNIINGNIKIVISFNKDKSRRNLMGYFIKTRYPKESDYQFGVSLVSLLADRRNPGIKLINKELREISNKLIDESDAYEVLLINSDGYITEGSRSNVFLIKDNEIFTSPIVDVLPGITRLNVIYICNKLGFKVTEKRIPFSELKNLDGVFITGTSPKVLPVRKVDEFEFQSESIILHKIMKEFDNLIDEYIKNYK